MTRLPFQRSRNNLFCHGVYPLSIQPRLRRPTIPRNRLPQEPNAIMSDLLNLLSESRMRIVELIKRRGSVTVDETMDALGLAETTVRQHLDRLDEKGLIDGESVPDGPGRPTIRYRLSAAGRQLFPGQDAALLGNMLDFLVKEGYPGVIDAFFHQMWAERQEELVEAMERADATTLEERLAIVEQFLAREGFLPEIDIADERVCIRECNCPFSESVRATKLPCRLEAQFLEFALQRELSRVSYMPEGHPTCTYEFSAPELSHRDDADAGR